VFDLLYHIKCILQQKMHYLEIVHIYE